MAETFTIGSVFFFADVLMCWELCPFFVASALVLCFSVDSFLMCEEDAAFVGFFRRLRLLYGVKLWLREMIMQWSIGVRSWSLRQLPFWP